MRSLLSFEMYTNPAMVELVYCFVQRCKGRVSGNNSGILFFLFLHKKTDVTHEWGDNLDELSKPYKIICIECQGSFSGKNRKNMTKPMFWKAKKNISIKMLFAKCYMRHVKC